MPAKGESAFKEHAIEWDDQKVARLWDYYARRDDEAIYFSKRFGHRILKVAGLPLNEPLAVLDFGCGPGFIWEHLIHLEAKWAYTGLDFSQGSIDEIKRRAEGHARFRGALRASALPTTLPDSKFDVVLLLEVVEHLDQHHLESTLREVRRTLKPGGIMVISTPNDEDLSICTKFCPECGAIFHEWQHVRKWTAESLVAAMGQHGFNVRRVKALNFAAFGVVGRLIRLARMFLLGKRVPPHLIALFEKA